MKKGYKENIEQLTIENTAFRKVLYTGEQMQLVLMSLAPGEDVGAEIHPENDQFFRFEKGEGKVLINGHEYTVADGDAVIVPRGSEHNVINLSSSEPLHFYTLYAPPHHQDGKVHDAKTDAETDHEEFDGKVTEI